MKKEFLFATLFALLVFCIVLFGACSERKTDTSSSDVGESSFSEEASSEIEQLPKPNDVLINDGRLTWSGTSENGYIVSVDGVEYYVSDNEFDLTFLYEMGERYEIMIKALGDEVLTSNSDWKNYSYSITETKGLRYVLINGGKEYEVSRGNADISGYVVIPDFYEGIPVTRIADRAFDEGVNNETKKVRLPKYLREIGVYAFTSCIAINRINFPAALKTIEQKAFWQCTNLKTLILPESVETVGENAFYGCTSLSSVDLGSVKTIGDRAFYNCEALEEIVFPSSVTSVGSNAFCGCAALYLVTIENPDGISFFGSNVFYKTKWYYDKPDGYVMMGCIIYKFKGNMPEGAVVDGLPTGVKSIAGNAFGGCLGLKEITLPNGTKLLGGDTFRYCTSLEKVVLPNDLKEIPSGMFNQCSSLVSVEIPYGVESIGNGAFCNCSALKEISLPKSVKTIEALAFSGCSSLKRFVVPEGVTELSAYLLSNSKALSYVVIPKGVKTFSERAFMNFPSTATIYYEGTEEDFGKITLEGNNDGLVMANVYYYSETVPSGEGKFWHYDESGMPTVWGS